MVMPKGVSHNGSPHPPSHIAQKKMNIKYD